MRFARWVFQGAGIYGLLVTVPLFFAEGAVNASTPPAITHPEYYYGFAGVTLAWQVLFLMIARNPARYRPLMPVTFLEKATGIAFVVLVFMHRSPPTMLIGLVDIGLGILFVLAYRATAKATQTDLAQQRG
jgi:hypothetical protein